MTTGQESIVQSAGEIERWVLDACRDLGLPIESGTDDFFAMGGTSLTAVRLVARAEAEFGEDCLPPEDIYESSALRDIAAAIVRNRGPVVVGPSERQGRGNGEQ
ncbi:acyl carrier protein [Kutzneria sp. NPDC051319]|uniref:acyl carrier protein n=1 Tax=Kutzneria sp. NPDC051319 TaxID=3155047 RepID=UPI00343213C3